MRNRRRISALLVAFGIITGAALVSTADDGPGNNPPPKQDGRGGPGGPGERGGPGGAGGGREGPGGPGGGFHLLPRFIMEKLQLTDDQRKQFEDLEKETKAKLEKILTPEQLKIMQEARPPRPAGGRGPAERGQGGQGERGQGERGAGDRGPGGPGPDGGGRVGPPGGAPGRAPGGGGAPGDQRQPPPERPAN